MSTLLGDGEDKIHVCANASEQGMLRALETCRMYIHLQCATPGCPESDRPTNPVDGRVEEIQDNKLDIYAFRKSDKAIVVEKQTNKEDVKGMLTESAEFVERRALAERNTNHPPVTATQSAGKAECGLVRVRAAARQINGCTFDSKQEPDALVAHVRICAGA